MVEISTEEWIAIVATVEEKLRNGASRETALQAAGVAPAVYRKWFKRGLDGEEPYASWIEGMTATEAEAETEDVKAIRQAKAWQARAWLLERRYPDKWGQKIQIEVAKEVEKVLAVASEMMDVDQYEKFLSKIAAKEGLSRDNSTGPAEDTPERQDKLH